MKKDSAFKLKSGNKPSIAKMMGISPIKRDKRDNRSKFAKAVDEVKQIGAGIKNVVRKRDESGLIPIGKYQTKRLVKNFKEGYKKRENIHRNRLVNIYPKASQPGIIKTLKRK